MVSPHRRLSVTFASTLSPHPPRLPSHPHNSTTTGITTITTTIITTPLSIPRPPSPPLTVLVPPASLPPSSTTTISNSKHLHHHRLHYHRNQHQHGHQKPLSHHYYHPITTNIQVLFHKKGVCLEKNVTGVLEHCFITCNKGLPETYRNNLKEHLNSNSPHAPNNQFTLVWSTCRTFMEDDQNCNNETINSQAKVNAMNRKLSLFPREHQDGCNFLKSS